MERSAEGKKATEEAIQKVIGSEQENPKHSPGVNEEETSQPPSQGASAVRT